MKEQIRTGGQNTVIVKSFTHLSELFAHVGKLFETSASNFSFLRIFYFFRDCSSDKLVYSTHCFSIGWRCLGPSPYSRPQNSLVPHRGLSGYRDLRTPGRTRQSRQLTQFTLTV